MVEAARDLVEKLIVENAELVEKVINELSVITPLKPQCQCTICVFVVCFVVLCVVLTWEWDPQ